MSVDLTYFNPLQNKPIECVYELPIDQEIILTKLIIEINDKVIEANVTEKQDAREKYEDAVANGNFAVMAERQQYLTLRLGNL